MDGTTLNHEGRLAPATVDAVRRAHAASVLVIIASGRQAASLQPYVDELRLSGPLPVVCFNGACVMLMEAGQPPREVRLVQLDRETASRVLDVCDDLNLCVSFCQPHGSIASPRNEKHVAMLRNFEALDGGIVQERLADCRELLDRGELPLKLMGLVAGDTLAAAARAKERLPEGLVTVIGAEMQVEFLNPAATKGATLRWLCAEVLRLPLEEVVAFGDGINDVEMLEAVGHGVAMQNAREGLKNVADRVSAWSNDQDGIARELTALLDAGALQGCAAARPALL